MSETQPLAHSSSSVREVLNTHHPDAINVLYNARISEKMKCFLTVKGILNPCSGYMCRIEDLYKQSYVQIHENRVEVNMPSRFQCCICLGPCHEINDYVQVYYFDKRIAQQADVAKFCSPICCPIGTNPVCGGYLPPAVTFMYPCCPTCFDACGQGAVLHGPLPILCCHQFAQIPFLENSEEFVQQFNRIKSGQGITDDERKPQRRGGAGIIQNRTAYNTAYGNQIYVVHKAPLSQKMKCCLTLQGILNPCSGLLCKAEEVYNNSYVQIHENRVEVNLPSPFQFCLCLGPCSQINDYVQVYYFDRRIAQEADVGGFCSPICCPIGINPACGGYVPPAVTFPYPCCPSCWNMCGETAVLHGKMPVLCCHQFAQIPFLEDANLFVQEFKKAQNGYLSGEPLAEALEKEKAPQPMKMDDNVDGVPPAQ